MIKGARDHHIHAISIGIDFAQHILAGLGCRIDISWTHGVFFAYGAFPFAHMPILLSRAHQQKPGLFLQGPNGFQHIGRSFDIDIYGKRGVFPGERHRTLRGQMDDIIRGKFLQGGADGSRVQDVDIIDGDTLFFYCFLGHFGRAHRPAQREHLIGQVPADKAGRPDDKRFHLINPLER